MEKRMYKKPKANKFTKAIRNECNFDDAYLINEIKEHYLENINVFADDLLIGLKSIQKKTKKEQKEYFDKLLEVFKKYKLDKIEYDECYLGKWDNNYPAPSNGFYVNNIIKNIKDKKFVFDKAIADLELFLNNNKKEFEKKSLSDDDIVYMCDKVGIEELYNYDDINDKRNKVFLDIVEKGRKLGSKRAKKINL